VVGPKADDGGLYIRTTLDSRLQTLARVALMKGLEAYDHRHG
jgi:penicillin-binding protein 1A